jgi:hypothetical protein
VRNCRVPREVTPFFSLAAQGLIYGVLSANFTENLIMDFYERIKSHVKIKGLTIDGYFSSLFAGDKNKESFSGWKKRHIYPRADEALIRICGLPLRSS